MDDALIEAIIKIGNNPKFIQSVEPNIMQPLQLSEWMVKRTMKAVELLYDEIQRTKQSDNRDPKRE